MKLFDTHSHYNDEQFRDDLDEIISNTMDSEVEKFVCVGYNEKSSIDAIKIAQKNSNIYAAVGISPQEAPESIDEIDNMVRKIEELAKNDKVVAIGEIGLDYHYDGYDKQIQRILFSKQIELANKLDLPISIHSRDARNRYNKCFK